MPFSLVPREMKFFDLFDEIAAIIRRAADRLVDMVNQFDRLGERSYELREDVHACNDAVRRTIEAIARSFITPFDRENIHGLARALGAIVEQMDRAAYRLEVFNISRITPDAVVLSRIIRDCCGHIVEGVRLFRNLKNAPIIEGHMNEVGRLWLEIDRQYREIDKALFASPPDILDLIKWREIYASFRETVGACNRAAFAISEIVIKGD